MKSSAILILILMIFYRPLYSYEVRKVIVAGKIDIDLEEAIALKKNNLSEKEIRALTAKITDIYHSKGFTQVYIDKAIVKKNGILEIHVVEPKIADIKIFGVDGSYRRDLRTIFMPGGNEFYNKRIIKDRAEAAERLLGYKIKRIFTDRGKNGDIILNIYVKQRRGYFSGRMGYDRIYGFLPVLYYIYPFEASAVSAYAAAGYRKGEVKKLEGDIRIIPNRKRNSVSLFYGVNSGRLVNRWETADIEYRAEWIMPFAGLKYFAGIFKVSLYLSEKAVRLKNYPGSDKLRDSRVTVDAVISNRELLLSRKEGYRFFMSAAGGRETVNNRFYSDVTIEGLYPVFPAPRLRLVPEVKIKYTSSKERLFWSYIYESYLFGYYGDFTSARWKSIAGINSEFEILYSLLYFGPFIYRGYFLDERNKRLIKTGAGIKSVIRYNKVFIDVIYSWDIELGPGKGGLFFSAEALF